MQLHRPSTLIARLKTTHHRSEPYMRSSPLLPTPRPPCWPCTQLSKSAKIQFCWNSHTHECHSRTSGCSIRPASNLNIRGVGPRLRSGKVKHYPVGIQRPTVYYWQAYSRSQYAYKFTILYSQYITNMVAILLSDL